MKLKSIILLGAAAMALNLTLSCEDFLNVDSKTKTYVEDNQLNSANDTVYSVMGIIQRMQKVADRTVILGEARGELLEVTEQSTSDLQALVRYEFDEENRYNNITDYYAIINNCNYYLATADTTYIRDNKKVFLGEYATVLTYRAWTYLQLGQIYGKVPFVDKPILSGDDADLSKWPQLTIDEIAARLIPELEKFVDTRLPEYGKLKIKRDEGQDREIDSEIMQIPIRVILGDLCLWAGEFEKAAIYYHDFLTDASNPLSVTDEAVRWYSTDFISSSSSYNPMSMRIQKNAECITAIPLEFEEYDGITSDLLDIFTSTEDNYYYYQTIYSKALEKLSADQVFCYHYFKNRALEETLYPDKDIFTNPLLKGDLRVQDMFYFQTVSFSNGVEAHKYNPKYLDFEKVVDGFVTLYRKQVIYLRLAEAMNRLGLPESAFAILKYGLCDQYVNDSLIISKEEKAFADGISTKLLNWPSTYYSPVELQYGGGDGMSFKPSEELSGGRARNTMGLHDRGSGYSVMNEHYVIPAGLTQDEKIKWVEERILDEMALETFFEGYRFGDLLRISMHRAGNTGFADSEFFASKVASRNGTEDSALKAKLTSTGNSFNEKWFLPISTKK